MGVFAQFYPHSCPNQYPALISEIASRRQSAKPDLQESQFVRESPRLMVFGRPGGEGNSSSFVEELPLDTLSRKHQTAFPSKQQFINKFLLYMWHNMQFINKFLLYTWHNMQFINKFLLYMWHNMKFINKCDILCTLLINN